MWKARDACVLMVLVYVWVKRARASPELLLYAKQQHDLILVH